MFHAILDEAGDAKICYSSVLSFYPKSSKEHTGWFEPAEVSSMKNNVPEEYS